MSKQSIANQIVRQYRDEKRKDILPIIIRSTECSEAYASTLYSKARKHVTEALKNAKSAMIDNNSRLVYVGDTVEFKSDIEQCGVITDIKSSTYGKVLVLENENGFSGDYLRYATITEEDADRCW